MTSFDKLCVNDLLNDYDRIMSLKLFVDGDMELKEKYIAAAKKHNQNIINNSLHIDAGFDLFSPRVEDPIELYNFGNQRRFFGPNWKDFSSVNKLDFKVCCSAQMICNNGKCFNTGYYMYPRSSLSKTKLRLANSTGIIDAGYRGHIMGMFDVVGSKDENLIDCDFIGYVFDKYVQICAPGLVPILVDVVNCLEDLGEKTLRGSGGFGSTGGISSPGGMDTSRGIGSSGVMEPPEDFNFYCSASRGIGSSGGMGTSRGIGSPGGMGTTYISGGIASPGGIGTSGGTS